MFSDELLGNLRNILMGDCNKKKKLKIFKLMDPLSIQFFTLIYHILIADELTYLWMSW